MNSEQETASKETNSRRASFYLLWVPYWQSPVKRGRTASCGLLGGVLCYRKSFLSFQQRNESIWYDSFILQKGHNFFIFKVVQGFFFFFNCKTYSTIEAIITCTCQSILTYYTVVMAFYLRGEGLKALHEMKGTQSQASIMHAISYLRREKWTETDYQYLISRRY